MRDIVPRLFCTSVLLHFVLLGPVGSAQQQFSYTKQAEFDAQGNIYVSSDQGNLIKMAGPNHCSEASVAHDLQTVVCMVGRTAEEFSHPVQLEIFQKNGVKKTIETGTPIREWHFWNDRRQIAVSFGSHDAVESYALYDVASVRLIEKLGRLSDRNQLPQWAKTQTQIEDESVPTSSALTQERAMWIAKVMRQISTVKPGMRRRDLSPMFTTEGGLSSRFQRTYVDAECPYIKVNVRFKAATNGTDALGESPEDIIESISQPYLAWSVDD